MLDSKLLKMFAFADLKAGNTTMQETDLDKAKKAAEFLIEPSQWKR